MSNTPAVPTGGMPLALAQVNTIVAWLGRWQSGVILLAVSIQLATLAGMIAQRAVVLAHGKTILLRVVPVDPRDMFRGDYVTLSYECSRLPPAGVDGLPATASYRYEDWAGRTVYVSLAPEPDGKHWRAEKFSTVPPNGGVYLRGTIARWGQVDFGIESYYVQEGTGRDYEQAVQQHKLSAEVAVAPDGQASLRAIRIE